MPLIYQHQINESTRLGVWHIKEPEDFFLAKVPLQRSITHWHKRLQHLAGRILLLELEPSFPLDLVRIADTRKPYLENEAWHFSISHCGDYAAAMISSRLRVGVDVELVNEKVSRIQHKFLSRAEFDLTRDFDDSLRLLTACWSIKECLFKWYGKGEVDFIQHLHIHSISYQDNEGMARCSILKDVNIELKVQFLFFNNNCLSWVY
jgi:phosphopantetheinyl transferase